MRGAPGLESASLSCRVAVSFTAPRTAAATFWDPFGFFFSKEGEEEEKEEFPGNQPSSSDRNRFRRMVGGQVKTWTLHGVEPEAIEGLLGGSQSKRNGPYCGAWNSREPLCNNPTQTIASHFHVVQNIVLFSPLS